MTRLVTVPDSAREQHPRLVREFCASGISVAAANTVLNPVEVIKTRMQLSGASAIASAAAAASKPSTAAASSSSGAPARPSAAYGGGGALLPRAARYMSHTTAPTAAPHPAAAGTASVLPPRGFPVAPPPPPPKMPRAAVPTAAADGALAASLRAAEAAVAAAPTRRLGFAATARQIYELDGAGAFARGIQASATRAVFNGGIRLGLYDPIKTAISRDGSGRDLNVLQKLAAGSVSGGIGAVLTTPIELAKTRLQAPGAETRSMSAVLKGVVAQHGVAGLWRGATPSVVRLILLNSTMVATYDEIRGRIARASGITGAPLVLASSMVAGVCTTTVINPADVARAYMQTGRGTSLLGVVRGIVAREGARGLLKGWTAAYARTGPQCIIIMSVSEVVRPMFGLTPIGGSG